MSEIEKAIIFIDKRLNNIKQEINRLIKENKEFGVYKIEGLRIECCQLERIKKLIQKQEKENTDLKEMYIRTAKNFDEKGKTELAEYMLAQIEEIPTFTTWEEYTTWVSKYKVKELKEKVHKTLDANGITRAYQMFIDKDFDELLGKE